MLKIILCLIFVTNIIKCETNLPIDDNFDINIQDVINNSNEVDGGTVDSSQVVVPPVFDDYGLSNDKNIQNKVEARCHETDDSRVVVCSEIPSNCDASCRNDNNRLRFDSQVKKIDSFAFKEYIFSEKKFDLEFEGLYEIDEDSFRGLIIIKQLNLIINGSFENQKLVINKYSFRGITMENGAILNVIISNYKTIEFNGNSLNGFKLLDTFNTNVNIRLQNNENILFKEKCAFKWHEFNQIEGDDEVLLLDDDGEHKIEINENTNKTKVFTISVNRVKQVKIEKNSFYGFKQEPNSTFQLLISRFDTIELDASSFSSIKQNSLSKFEINLYYGKHVKLSENIFQDIKQAVNSEFIILIDSASASICVPKNTLKNFQQDIHSSLKLSFIGNKNNLYIDSFAFTDIIQQEDSFVGIYGHQHEHVYFKSKALESLIQTRKSFFEIVFNEAASLTFDDYTFSSVKQLDESRIRVGFVTNGGIFQQSSFVFNKFEQDLTSFFTYDFSEKSIFNLKFPPRVAPRIPLEIESNKNLFPNLGIANRPPNRISLIEYVLKEDDFCRISEIPSDLIIQLAPKTTCTCAVFYLYRAIRKSPNYSWLSNTPKCYQDIFNSQENDIASIEADCNFDIVRSQCREKTNTVIKIKTELKCSIYMPEVEDYLTIEMNKDLEKDEKTENDVYDTNKDDESISNKSNFESNNKTAWYITIVASIIILVLTILILGVFVFMKNRNNSKKNNRNRLKNGNLSSDSDIDCRDELNNNGTDTKVSLGDDCANITVEYSNPIYKKNKAKTPSIDSENYLIEKNNLKEAEKYNLIVRTEECSSSRAFITKIDQTK
jgi:hypothetical protein